MHLVYHVAPENNISKLILILSRCLMSSSIVGMIFVTATMAEGTNNTRNYHEQILQQNNVGVSLSKQCTSSYQVTRGVCVDNASICPTQVHSYIVWL